MLHQLSYQGTETKALHCIIGEGTGGIFAPHKCKEANCNKCIMESLWLKLRLKNEKIIVGCIYRHPDGGKLQHFNDAYAKYIQNLDWNAICIIGVDLNIDLLLFKKKKC